MLGEDGSFIADGHPLSKRGHDAQGSKGYLVPANAIRYRVGPARCLAGVGRAGGIFRPGRRRRAAAESIPMAKHSFCHLCVPADRNPAFHLLEKRSATGVAVG